MRSPGRVDGGLVIAAAHPGDAIEDFGGDKTDAWPRLIEKIGSGNKTAMRFVWLFHLWGTLPYIESGVPGSVFCGHTGIFDHKSETRRHRERHCPKTRL